MAKLRSNAKLDINVKSGVILLKGENIYEVIWDNPFSFKLINLTRGTNYIYDEDCKKKIFTLDELEKMLEKEEFIYVASSFKEYIRNIKKECF